MTVRMLVAGLPEAVTYQDLCDLFSAFGRVRTSSVPRDPLSGRPLGYGELVFEAGADVVAAVGVMDGMLLMDSHLRVVVDEPGRERPLRIRVASSDFGLPAPVPVRPRARARARARA